jgi:molybdate transport system substrate-binding protein
MKTRMVSVATVLTAACLLWLGQGAGGQGAAIRVLASNGIKTVLEEFGPQAERAIRHPFAIRFGSSTSLKQSIDDGEAFDVAIVTTELLDQLIKEKKVAAGTSGVVARSGIGIGIRQGAPAPDIRTPEALKRALLESRIAYAEDGASRSHIVSMLDRMGITSEMASKTILEQGTVRSAAKVVAGDADLLITLISEILPLSGVTLLGPLPQEFQHYVALAAGVGVRAADPAAARALVAFLTAPTIAPVLKAKGMEKP